MPEAAFNAACYHTGLGDYQNALEELGRAETLCRQTYDDQEDELSSELAQVRLQDSFLKIDFTTVDLPFNDINSVAVASGRGAFTSALILFDNSWKTNPIAFLKFEFFWW